MLTVRPANERGHFKNRWLDSRYSFSFAEYYDPGHMGVSVLRVINDDRIGPGAGFPTHAHNNMEIVSYVLEGELEHRDSMGNGSVIRPGDVQRMSAGSGVTHSEFNPSAENATSFLQIWLLPNVRGIEAEYQQKYFAAEEKQGKLKLLVSPDGRSASISAHSDAMLHGALLDRGQSIDHAVAADRVVYVHVIKGDLSINGEVLHSGDGVTIADEPGVEMVGIDHAEVLLFDMPSTNN